MIIAGTRSGPRARQLSWHERSAVAAAAMAGWRAARRTTIASPRSASPMAPMAGFCCAALPAAAGRQSGTRSRRGRSGPSAGPIRLARHGRGSSSTRRRPPALEPDKLAVVKRIWRNATPAPGTEVEIYLRSRSLATPVPPTLRYARLRHRESGRWLPCMLGSGAGRHTVASPVCIARTCGRTAAARRTWSQPRRCSARVAAAPSGSPLSGDGLPCARASRPA